MKKRYWISIIIFTVIAVVGLSCKSSTEKNQKNEEYTIKVAQELNVYGIKIKRLINHKFSQIEREIGATIQVDREVSVVFISNDKDFVLKGQATRIKDHIDFLYGPINDSAIYDMPGSVKPNTIVFYGNLKLNEKLNNKKTITKELGNILPQNQTTGEILAKVERIFLTGPYHEEQTIKLHFDAPDFAVAYFLITFQQGEIHYRYVFSKTKEIYPYL